MMSSLPKDVASMLVENRHLVWVAQVSHASLKIVVSTGQGDAPQPVLVPVLLTNDNYVCISETAKPTEDEEKRVPVMPTVGRYVTVRTGNNNGRETLVGRVESVDDKLLEVKGNFYTPYPPASKSKEGPKPPNKSQLDARKIDACPPLLPGVPLYRKKNGELVTIWVAHVLHTDLTIQLGPELTFSESEISEKVVSRLPPAP